MSSHDDAVSPIVGTMLLVAITVVLGAAIWIIVANLSKDGPSSAPNVLLVQDERQGHLTSPTTNVYADWSHIRLISSADAHFALNGVASLSSRALPADQAVAASLGYDRVDASDYLDFCVVGVSGPATVKTVYDDPSQRENALLQEVPFAAVRPCL